MSKLVSAKTVYLSLYLEVTQENVGRLIAAMIEGIKRENPDIIYILFSSRGGNVEAGVTLYNFLRALPVKLVMHNIGNVDSIAATVFLAADERYAAPHSSFLFHGVTWNLNANSWGKNQVAEIVSNIEATEAKLIGIITERTNLTEADIQTLFNKGESQMPNYALAKGLIREIREPSIPPGANVFSF